MDGDLWTFGLAGWVLQDGGYPDLEVGDRIDFSVEVWPDARLARRPRAGSTAVHLYENRYDVAGTVHPLAELSVLETAGLRAWWAGDLPRLPRAPSLDVQPFAVEGTVALGVDQLLGLEDHADLPLVYRWQIVAIDLVTTAWVIDPHTGAQGPRAYVRDPERVSRRPLDRTRTWKDEPAPAEYLLTCRLLDPSPRRDRVLLGPQDPVALRRGLVAAWRSTGRDVELRDALLAAYADPARGYHDLTHLTEVLDRLDGLGCSDDAVVLAAWFHDAVYDGGGDDEDRSAAWAEAALADDPALAAEVGRLVRLTARHRPAADDRAGQLLCDADLGILAAAPERYAAYVAGVRREYAAVPDPDFRAGRRAVLEDLLAKDHLFETPEARTLWEGVARDNLTAEVEALS